MFDMLKPCMCKKYGRNHVKRKEFQEDSAQATV